MKDSVLLRSEKSRGEHEAMQNAFARSLIVGRLLTVLLFLALGSGILWSQVESYGLEGKSVTSLSVYNGVIYAGTDTEGVFRRTLGPLGSMWESLGLLGHQVNTVHACKVDSSSLWVFAGVVPKYAQGDTIVLYVCKNGVPPWLPFDSGMVHRPSARVTSVSGSGSEIYAAGPGSTGAVVYKLIGNAWVGVYDQGMRVASFGVVRVGARDGTVWAGGSYATLNPFVVRSPRGGHSWETVYSAPDDNFVWSMADDPGDTARLYVGLGGCLLRLRTDEAVSDTLLNSHSATFGALQVDATNQKHIYSGADSIGTFQLLETLDAGMTWANIKPTSALKGIWALALDPVDRSVVYAGTRGSGVVRCRSVISGLAETAGLPQNLYLLPNYPNPFNPSTTVSFSIHRKSFVSIMIRDLLGREIAHIVNAELTAGLHEVVWDGRNAHGAAVSSGTYICQLEVDGRFFARKMLLLK